MKQINSRRRVRLAAVALAAGSFIVVAARTPQAQTAPEPAPAGIPMADTVRVVRDRLPSDLTGASMATTVIDDDELTTTRQMGLDAALDLVPGVVAQSRSGGQDVRITVRGFGARGAGDRSNSGTTRGIRILLDGFPITEPDGRTSLDFADVGSLDRVRVVRSNSSVLFGSASGGLIDLVTHAPFTAPFYEVRTSGGKFGLMRTHVKGGFLVGSARMRLSGSDTRFDGWRDQSRAETTTMQASILATPATRTTLGLYLAGTRNHNEQPGPLTAAEMATDPRQANPTYKAQNARRENSIARVGVRVQQEFRRSDALVLSTFAEPKSLHRSERNRYRDFTRYHLGASGIYKWALPVGEAQDLRLNAGVDDAYQDGAVLFYPLGPGGSRGAGPPVNDQREAINNFGGFAELTLRPAGKWEVGAGARYDLVHYIYEDHLDPTLDDDMTLHSISPRGSVAFSYRPAHKVYAALSGGIEPPAFNEVDPPPEVTTSGLNPFLKPARSLTAELGTKGLKTISEDGKTYVRYDAALYGLEVRNDIIPFNGGAYYFTAGKSRRAGIELGGELQTGFGAHARVAATVSHNEYIDYQNDLGNFDGNESAGIPPYVLEARLGYDSPRGPYVLAGAHALGEYFADDANTARVPAYGIYDVTLGYKHAFSQTSLNLFAGVDNVLDEDYVASVFINGTNGRFFEPGMERSYLIGLTLGSR